MPKLPLFANEPLHDEAVTDIRKLLQNPESEGNLKIIDGLMDIHASPDSAMSEPLAYFVTEIGLVRGILCNFLLNTLDWPHLTGFQARMRAEINVWVLTHAAAAGFLTPRCGCQMRTPGLLQSDQR